MMRIWKWPIVLSALTIFGLLAALLGQDEAWWIASWIALGIPLLVIARVPGPVADPFPRHVHWTEIPARSCSLLGPRHSVALIS